MRGTTIELLWSHGIVCPLVRRSSRCAWGFYVAWKAGLHPKALFPHSTPERQSLFESHRQRRWLTHWSYSHATVHHSPVVSLMDKALSCCFHNKMYINLVAHYSLTVHFPPDAPRTPYRGMVWSRLRT